MVVFAMLVPVLAPAATVRGIVTTSDHLPLPGCTVTLDTHRTISDASGRYAFDDVAPGTHSLRFELAGFISATQAANVTDAPLELGQVSLEAEVTEDIVLDSPCTKTEPHAVLDQPSCSDYDFDTALIDALGRGDRSPAPLLQKRFEQELALSERHRIAVALLGHVANDAPYWNELAEHAANAIRFSYVDERPNPEFATWCAARGWEPRSYFYAAVSALGYAGSDPRGRALLRRALHSESVEVVETAVVSFAAAHDESVLPEIEEAIARSSEVDELALSLVDYDSPAADAVAMRELSAPGCEIYAEIKQHLHDPQDE